MKRLIAVALLLFAGAVHADVFRYDKPDPLGYGATLDALTADLTMWIDPVNGTNNSNCKVQASPCRTIAFAQRYIPHVIRYNVTLKLLAGTYDEVLVFSNMDDGVGAAKTITLEGQTWNAFTPATGPQSGQFTSGSGRVATMSGATWTVNDLRSSHVKITSGTKNGQYYPIASNTADGITVPISTSDMTAIATATFEIVRPAAIVSKTGVASIVKAAGSVALNLTVIDVGGGATTASVLYSNLSTGLLNSCRVQSAAAFAYSVFSNGPTTQISMLNTFVATNTNVNGVAGNRLVLYNSAVAGAAGTGILLLQSLTTSQFISDAPAGLKIQSGTFPPTVSATGLDIVNATTGVIITARADADVMFSGGTISASGAAIEVGSTLLGRARIILDSTTVTAGTDGVRFDTAHNMVVLRNTASITAGAYGINLAWQDTFDAGAFNNLRVGASASISGATADINLGGGTTTSLVALRADPDKTIVDLTTLNRAVGF